MKKIILILSLVFVILSSFVSAVWDDTDFNNRKLLNFTNTTQVFSPVWIKLSEINETAVGNEMRFIDSGSLDNLLYQLLDENNQTNGVPFWAVVLVNATSNTNINVYYNKNTPVSDGNTTYIYFYQDFNDKNASGWNNGSLMINSASGSCDFTSGFVQAKTNVEWGCSIDLWTNPQDHYFWVNYDGDFSDGDNTASGVSILNESSGSTNGFGLTPYTRAGARYDFFWTKAIGSAGQIQISATAIGTIPENRVIITLDVDDDDSINIFTNGATELLSVDGTDTTYQNFDFTKFDLFGLTGIVGETKFFKVMLTSKKTFMYEKSSAVLFNPQETQVPPPFALIDLIFSVDNDASNPKTLFIEGEEFNVFLNWSLSNGTILGNETGDCNVTLRNGLFSQKSPNDNFTICGSGCDFSTFTQNFSLLENLTAVMDTARAFVCNEQLQQQDAIVNISCGEISFQETRDGANIALCSQGFSFVTVNTTACLGSNEINLSVTYEGAFNRRKRVVNLTIDREFRNHTLDGGVFKLDFNSSLGLWSPSHTQTYYAHGLQDILGGCTDTSDEFNITIVENITIENIAPQVFLGQINYSLGNVNLISNVVVEYGSGVWAFDSAVNDDDLDTIIYTLRNITNDIIFQTISSVSIVISVNDTLFRDESQMPYNYSIFANDTVGNVTRSSILFNVTDTSNPVCTGFDNSTQLNNTVFTWNVNCTDESFFSLNISCDNNFNSFTDGLNVQTFNFGGSTAIVNDTLCSFEYCDGHTEREIKPLLVSDETSNIKRTFDNKITILSDTPFLEFKTDFFIDRHKFKLKFYEKQTGINFTITSDEFIYIMDSIQYMGWLVTGDYWLDFESKDVKSVEVKRVSDTEIKIYLIFWKELNSITFDSIGKKNCVSGFQLIESTQPVGIGEENSIFDSLTCPLNQSLAFVFGYFMLFVLIFGLYVLNIVYIKYPFVGVLIGFSIFFMAFPLLACSHILAVTVMLFAWIIIYFEGTH